MQSPIEVVFEPTLVNVRSVSQTSFKWHAMQIWGRTITFAMQAAAIYGCEELEQNGHILKGYQPLLI